MAKRVSLQGKGVELFFGGTPRDPQTASGTEGESNSAPQESPDASVHTRTHARTDNDWAETILRSLAEKQWLASSTFRFHPEELERLDALFETVSRAKPRRISKNDLVRLGLLWLLNDHEIDPQHSLVARLLERV